MTAPMAVRLAWGRLHLGRPTGRGYDLICRRTITCTDTADDIVVYTGRDVGRAWRNEVICLDCAARVRKALRRLDRELRTQ